MLFNKWAAGLPLGSDERRAMKKAGIPTQAGLTVEVPIKTLSNISQVSHETVPQHKRKAASFLGPASNVVIGGVAISPGLLLVLNSLTNSGPIASNGNAQPLKIKKYEDIRKNAKEIQAKEDHQAKQKELESAIKYPIEDLEVRRNFTPSRRPQPQALPDSEEFDHVVKVWTFLSTFDGFLGIECMPFLKLQETFADACSNTGKRRFPLEHLIIVLLELICTDAESVTNLYIPQGINDILQAPKGYSIQDIGDWRKATIPVPLTQWGCVLLGCIKELFCPETLPNGQAIIDHLESDITAHPDSAVHLRLVQNNFAKADSQLKSKSKSKAAPAKSSFSIRQSSRSRPQGSGEDESEDEDVILDEEDPKKREDLEPIIQQQFYSLSVNDKTQLLDFLIEQSLGTSKFKAYHEETYDEISSLRRDRIDLSKEAKSIQEQLIALKEESKQMKDDYKSLYEDSPQPDATDSTSSAELPVRSSRPKARLRKEGVALSQAIQSKADAIQRLEISEMKLYKKSEQLLKEIDESLSLLRFRHLGEDRFFNRYYFIPCSDGPLLLVQSTHPSLLAQLTAHPTQEIESYRAAIEGDPETKSLCSWGFYSSASQIRELLSWFCVLGIREKSLKNAIEKVLEKFPSDSK
ncbi:hypothetical protein DSO57_1035660 [Entomophthora muscae]|uniref:Uncharacterized protein n=1 Tax=Entomophthora muscae TaxID=34485 RepID=A0ACC2UK08_9FUNG|nr:hypothetical protein DSO57_1035660 [Entomophthora muscae]